MSGDAKRRAALVAAIARDWNDAGIRYVVSHGIELYPDGIGRDLDIHVDIDAMPDAIATAMQHLRDAGYTITLPPSRGTGGADGFARSTKATTSHSISSLTSFGDQWYWSRRPSRPITLAPFRLIGGRNSPSGC